MSQQQRYKVIKPMLYQGVVYQIGSQWIPSGHRNDPAIIKARMVVPLVEIAEAQAPVATQQPARKAR